jgi:hypothetical protein
LDLLGYLDLPTLLPVTSAATSIDLPSVLPDTGSVVFFDPPSVILATNHLDRLAFAGFNRERNIQFQREENQDTDTTHRYLNITVIFMSVSTVLLIATTVHPSSVLAHVGPLQPAANTNV